MEVVETGDGSLTLIHKDHGEWFHSQDGAKFEAQALYINSSNYIHALSSHTQLSLLDVGLGLGYNACSTIEAWSEITTTCHLKMLSLESDSDLLTQLESSQSNWQENWSQIWKKWCQQTQIAHPHHDLKVEWTRLLGDGKHTLKQHTEHPPFHFIWQDPFSHAHGTTLWDKEWFELLYQRSAKNCVLMSYSVARPVRDALTEAGWEVERIAATSRKRNWLRATKTT